MNKPLTRSPSIGSTFNKGLEIYKENFLLVFLASLISGIITFATCGICSGAMQCGVFGILLALLRKQEPKPQVGDLFNGFQKFLPAFVTSLVFGVTFTFIGFVLGIIPILGWLVSLVLGFFVEPTIMVLAIFLIQDQDATIGEAIITPVKMICEKNFWSMSLVVFVAGLLGMVGLIACGIGLFFTIPFSVCMIAAAYEEAAGEPPVIVVPNEPASEEPPRPASEEPPASL